MQTRIFDPLPYGKGFSVRSRIAALGFAASAVIGGAFPAHAANVSVTLDVSRGFPPAVVAVAHCTVSVPVGAKGAAVLQAAVTAACIQSYAVTSQYGFGTYLECVNADCEIPRGNPTTHGTGTYWRQTVNGAATCYGLDGFEAAQGKQLGLQYAPTGTLAVDIALGCAE